jgi:hypothetical protein
MDRPVLTAGPFIYLEQLSLMVCSICKYAVLADGILNHLLHRRHQYSLSAGEKKKIISIVSTIPGILEKQDDLLDFRFPLPETKSLPFIEAPKHDGLRCNDYGFVTRQTGNMQKHCRQKHRWQNDWTKRGNVKRKAKLPRDLPWTTGVSYQRLFDHGSASSWFEVGKEPVI